MRSNTKENTEIYDSIDFKKKAHVLSCSNITGVCLVFKNISFVCLLIRLDKIAAYILWKLWCLCLVTHILQEGFFPYVLNGIMHQKLEAELEVVTKAAVPFSWVPTSSAHP